MLAYRQDDLLSPFEESHFLEHTWRLAQQDPALTEGEYALRQGSVQRAAIDIGDRHTVQIKFMAELHEQMRMLASDRDWTEADLISWLDRTISHPDITFAQSTAFITAVVQKLQSERNLALAQLVHDKYRLRQAIAAKIDTHRQAARNQAYQQLLLPESPLEVTPELCFTYDPYRYPCTPYRGSYQFFKHFYPEVGGFDSGEEEACAIVIDTLPKVDAWVRNPDRGTRAFWLQTSSDKFYPDFVCKLQDGRFLVVEYKGADRWSNDDSREKRTIGEVWEKRSNGQCLFIMPKGKDFEAIRAKL
jgi:type III restriction enzyme